MRSYHSRIFPFLPLFFVITATSISLVLVSLTQPPYTTTGNLHSSFRSSFISFKVMVFDNLFNNFIILKITCRDGFNLFGYEIYFISVSCFSFVHFWRYFQILIKFQFTSISLTSTLIYPPML